MSATITTLALRRDEVAYDEAWTPKRRLQEGHDIEAPPQPDTRIEVSPGTARWRVRAVATPSRRKRATQPSAHPNIEQVFTLDNTHRQRTPHLGYHAAHTATATGQHQATASAQEHRATNTRVAALASQTLTPPHPRPNATPTKGTGEKVPPFAPLGDPMLRTDRPASTGLQRPVLQPRVRDELGPGAW